MKSMSMLARIAGTNFFSSLVSVLRLLLISVSVVGCNTTSQTSDFGRPFGAPFSVQKAGTRVEFEIHAKEHRGYQFDLHYMYDERNPNDRERVRKLVGSLETGRNGKPIFAGVPVTLRFRIDALDVSTKKMLVEKEVTDMRLTSWGGGSFAQTIVTAILKPGRYLVTVESLANAPALDETQVNLSYGVDTKSGPLS